MTLRLRHNINHHYSLVVHQLWVWKQRKPVTPLRVTQVPLHFLRLFIIIVSAIALDFYRPYQAHAYGVKD